MPSSSLKILRFSLGEHPFCASATYVQTMVPYAEHFSPEDVLDVRPALGIPAEVTPRHAALLRHPSAEGRGEERWLAIERLVGLESCSAKDILVFPPVLRGDWASRTLLPACLLDDEQGGAAPRLTWMLDLDALLLHSPPR